MSNVKDRPDLISIASEIGKATDKALDELSAQYDNQLKEYEETVLGQAKENGERKGVKMVQKYNNGIRKAAETQHNLNQDKLAEAKIKLEAVTQAAKIKILGLIGM